MERKIILASGSPRRRDLLARYGIKFEILVTNADENIDKDIRPDKYVSIISRRKAESAVSEVNANHFIIIAADTIVSIENKILGKPKDRADAKAMLEQLENRWHTVLTGLTIAYDKDNNIHYEQEVCTSEVKFKPLSDADIRAYIDTDEPYDKAGAYAIQGIGAQFVEEIRGSRENVMGLPMEAVMRMLRIGIDSPNTREI